MNKTFFNLLMSTFIAFCSIWNMLVDWDLGAGSLIFDIEMGEFKQKIIMSFTSNRLFVRDKKKKKPLKGVMQLNLMIR